jgi:hypothetical protein
MAVDILVCYYLGMSKKNAIPKPEDAELSFAELMDLQKNAWERMRTANPPNVLEPRPQLTHRRPGISPWPRDLTCGSYVLKNITPLNLIVGKNGTGKSRFLRAIGENLFNTGTNVFYISPERGGIFADDATTEDLMNTFAMKKSRFRNHVANYRSLSSHLLRILQERLAPTMEWDEIKSAYRRGKFRKGQGPWSFMFGEAYLSKINRLLTNVTIDESSDETQDTLREGPPLAHYIFRSYGGDIIPPDQLSSGELEIITLCSEILWFLSYAERISSVSHALLIDEPDLHLHPDLQARFARFLISELEGLQLNTFERTVVIIATHSTALICAMAESKFASIGTKYFGDEIVHQRSVDLGFKNTAPFFGHPLSKIINDDQILILEGEDDERVWAQAARTAQGRIKLYPCLAGSVDQQIQLERYCQRILPAIYDDPIAFSLRDGDGVVGPIEPLGVVKRYRLQCYAIENILLTDDCLRGFRSSWKDFCGRAQVWRVENSGREEATLIKCIIESADRARHLKIKSVRLLICHILGSNKPWEVHVGQAIGALFLCSEDMKGGGSASLLDFIGTEFLAAIGLQTAANSFASTNGGGARPRSGQGRRATVKKESSPPRKAHKPV